MATRKQLLIGLASGRSANGVDAVLVELRGTREKMKAKQIRYLHHPFPPELRERILSADSAEQIAPRELLELDRETAQRFAETANDLIEQSGVSRDDVSAVGSSGQAIAGIELASAALIAQRVGLPVVSGFAAGDIAAGGDGVGVTTWADWVLFRDKRLSRVLVHLGAIASLTFVPSDPASCDVIAFDVGPGMIVTDSLARKLFDSPFDTDGYLGSRGKVNPALLNELLANSYFHRELPKRTGVAQWSDVYLERLLMMGRKHRCDGEHLIATITELTARTVTIAVSTLTERPHQVILSGGGARNIHLVMRIRELMSPSSTLTAEKFGFDVRAMLPTCYALLAAARLDKHPTHIPGAIHLP